MTRARRGAGAGSIRGELRTPFPPVTATPWSVSSVSVRARAGAACRAVQNVIGTRTISVVSGVSRVTPTPSETLRLTRSLKR